MTEFMKTKSVVIDEILKSNRLPACPLVLTGLLRVLEDADATITDLAKCLAFDQSITVRVLRIVNSAFFGLPRSMRNIEEAALRLGFHEIWALAVGTQMNDMYKEAESVWAATTESLWHHSLKVGILARLIATRIPGCRAEDMFTAGIIHDVGKLALFSYDKVNYKRISANGKLFGHELVQEEINCWGIGHAELGGILLRQWNIPESLAAAVDLHHDPQRDGNPGNLATVLAAADALAHAAKKNEVPERSGLFRLDFSDGLLTLQITEALKLDGPECLRLTTDGFKAFEEVVGAFQ